MTSKHAFIQGLMDELGAPLRRFLSRKVGNVEDANDLAQEAFLRIYKLQRPEDLENPRAFLFQTAANLAIDQIRREQVHTRYIRKELNPVIAGEGHDFVMPSTERTVNATEQLDLLYAAMRKLPEKTRQAFLLHRAKDMTYAEIANEMGVSTSMVEKYIIQALRFCRKELGKQESQNG